MTEFIVIALWLFLGWLGTYLGRITFRRRYGKDSTKNDGYLWWLTLLGPFNLASMAAILRPWDRSRDL